MLNHTLLFKKKVLEIAYTNKLVKKKQPWPLIIGFLRKYKYNNNNICLSFDRTLLPKEQFFFNKFDQLFKDWVITNHKLFKSQAFTHTSKSKIS